MIEPLEYGEDVVVRHGIGGEERTVRFVGFAKKVAYVKWGLAGQYMVDLKTGQLLATKKRTASLWRLLPEFLERLQATQEAHTHDLKKKLKSNVPGRW